MGHEGAKPQRAIYLRNGRIFTTGFSRMSERQYALRNESSLKDPIILETLDTSNGVLYPFYDPDVNLLYLCAKGDSNIRYFEITDEAPYVHYISTFQSSEPQRGMGVMPKRGCDVHQCEIGRFYKLHSRGFCEVISFTVPRKSELFQDDLYPPTLADVPAISAEEWSDGKNAEPILFSLKDGYIPAKKQELKVTKKPNILDKMPAKNSNVSAGTADSSNQKMDEMVEEVRKMKATLLKHEIRIRDLEKMLESPGGRLAGNKPVHSSANSHGNSGLMPDEV
ncbi:coronin-1C-like isoform X2 [Centruroides sculpturatus]|uniref:coronin-1C-like isoform X2 n=1 Tax=Centruroides sculpturatus TaxID=218467 RepID=UPI000C6E0EDA|nr:coronin-1C-like isoform X2 [Centruroides sculpturatus]